MIYLELLIGFLKVGCFAFGGAYGAIPLIRDVVLSFGWLSDEMLTYMIAVSESTPGPIMVNLATYIGYKQGKILGALIATLGMCIPSFAIIYLISLFLNRFLEFEIVASAFKGIQIGVIFIIFMAGMKMLKKIKKTAFNITILSLTVVISVIFSIMMVDFSAIFYILISGFLGLIIYLVKFFKSKGDKKK